MIKKYILLLFLVFSVYVNSQVDYSKDWAEHFSYNNVKSIADEGNFIYAIVDNAAFKYDKTSGATEKISSINGLSGENTSTIHYSNSSSSLIIGYETGLLEIIKDNGQVLKVVDIVISDVSSDKEINAIYEFENKLYLSMQFGIVVYDLVKNEFTDTYFIGENSSDTIVNNILIQNNKIYATSTNGVYIADFSSNLNDVANWTLAFSGAFDKVRTFNSEVLASQGDKIYKLNDDNTLELKITESTSVKDFNFKDDKLIVSTSNKFNLYDVNYTSIETINENINSINAVLMDANSVYIGTTANGILRSEISDINTTIEIYPDGPTSNDIFSISVKNSDLWIVYGGYNQSSFNFLGRTLGVSHYNGSKWVQIPYNTSFPARDLTSVSIDPNHPNRAYINSYFSGILVIENDQPTKILNNANSGLGVWAASASRSLITNSTFDDEGNLWVVNSWGKDDKLLYKLENEVSVLDVDYTDVISRTISGIYEIAIDNTKNVWLGTRFGILVADQTGNQKAFLTSQSSQGLLPDLNVTGLAVDKNNKVWIGTNQGLVVFDDVKNIFTGSFKDTSPIIFLENGDAKRLLGSTAINDIYIDGADNKWFATADGGVVLTNSTGKKTLATFNTENSPLPSNTILKIQADESTGTVFFATSKGIVSYKSDVASFGDNLKEVYGYPNPALKQHSEVSIVGVDGSDLPEGTNVKILDVAGNLVFESNTVETQSNLGGKIVWNKRNLAGNKVASGVYIVLLFNAEGSQTASTKIAIIN